MRFLWDWTKRVEIKRLIGRRSENIEAASSGGERVREWRGRDAGEFLNHSSEVRSVGGENGGWCSS